MLDSSTKHPENRIHLYDPVGLITDGYSPSNYTVRPRRQTVSYDNFVEPNNNTNIGLGLRSYNSVPDANSTAGLRSYDSFEVDSFTLRSFRDTISSDTTVDSAKTMVDDRNDGGLRFVIAENVMEDDQLDAPTPLLWRPSSATCPKSLPSVQSHNTAPKVLVNSALSNPTSPNNNPKSVNFLPVQSTSPKASLNSLNSNHHNYQTMSPNSRTQAIAKGRKELMDMVRDLPETFYELSLKDIVEQKAVGMEMKKDIHIPEEKKAIKEVTTAKNHKETKKHNNSSKKANKSESKKKMMRNKSVDNGKFLLKTSVFPIFGSRKSKKSLNAASSFKVAPMPKSEQTSNGSVKVGEKEWRRKKSCVSSESDNSNGLSSQSTSSRSSSSSSRSNSSNGRRSNRFFPSCCIFYGRRVDGKK